MADKLLRRSDFDDRYTAFFKEIRTSILSGALKPGQMILPENTLAQEYNLSRSSVRKALAALVDEGLIVKVPGKGNFVAEIQHHPEKVDVLRLGVYVPSLELYKILKLLDKFEEEHPRVKVQPVRISTIDYPQTVRDLTEQGVLDMFMLTEGHFREFQPGTELADVTSFLPARWDTERDGYASVFNAYRHGKGLYAAPVVWSPVVLCYNKDLFDKAGLPYPDRSWTWETLVESARALTRDQNGDGEPEQYGFCFSSALNRWPMWLMQNGAKLQAGKRLRLDDPHAHEAVQFAVDLMYKHRVAPIFGHGMDFAAEDLFSRGKVAMVLTTYFYMNGFHNLRFEWDVAEPPMNRERATALLGMAFAVNPTSPRQELAQSLIRFFLAEPTQRFIQAEGCSLPVLKSVAESSANLTAGVHPPGYHTFMQTLEYARQIDTLADRKVLSVLSRELAPVWANMERVSLAFARAKEKLHSPQG